MVTYKKFNDCTGIGITTYTNGDSYDYTLFDNELERDEVFETLNSVMNGKYKRITFNIATNGGTVKTTGYIKGCKDIVIHKELEHNKYWTLSDYTTGCKITTYSPTNTREQLLLYLPTVLNGYYKMIRLGALEQLEHINK